MKSTMKMIMMKGNGRWSSNFLFIWMLVAVGINSTMANVDSDDMDDGGGGGGHAGVVGGSTMLRGGGTTPGGRGSSITTHNSISDEMGGIDVIDLNEVHSSDFDLDDEFGTADYDNSAQEAIALSWAQTAAMYGGNNATTESGRNLQSFQNHRFMSPSCTKGCESVKTWSEMGYNPYGSMVVIDCGMCIKVYTKDSPLILPNGIDIRGRLEIINNQKVEIETPFIRVQGILKLRSFKRVSGTPWINVKLTGKTPHSFIPEEPNTYACTSTLVTGSSPSQQPPPTPCHVGAKAIVVAGGRLDIKGVSSNLKTWVKLHDVLNPSTSIIVQSSGVDGYWMKGAQILITSHTILLKDYGVFTLVTDPQPYGSGLVKLNLDSKVRTPTVSVSDGDGFAVEVALLSRNIKFESVSDEKDKGGHLIILQTPKQRQLLVGVEFNDYGRLGELGRYPIHLHMCNDVYGSIISKNSIRNSNQRCVVIHGTHGAQIIENISHENMGHCYLTEDGGEINNQFIRNLGSGTRAATTIVRRGETDKSNPSTFWISNPQNIWEGNVAAGSVAFGYWFELPKGVKEPARYMESTRGMIPTRMNLGLFLDNVAHSNRKQGFKTYPHGYEPNELAIFQNIRSYKNNLDGIKFHRSKNIEVRGGVVADNRVGVDYDELDYFTLKDITIIGMTQKYKDIINNYHGPNIKHRDRVQGIELHTYKKYDESAKAATVENVRFERFTDTFAGTNVALINIDSTQDTSNGYFNAWATVKGMTVDGTTKMPSNAFDFMNAEKGGIKNLFLIDLDGSMEPGNSGKSGVAASIIGDNAAMRAFIDTSKCTANTIKKYLYCPRLCMRAISFYVTVRNTSTRVRITNKSTNKRYDYTGISIGTGRRYYSIVLPPGSFKAEFVTGTGSPVYPTNVDRMMEPALCMGAIEMDNLEIVGF